MINDPRAARDHWPPVRLLNSGQRVLTALSGLGRHTIAGTQRAADVLTDTAYYDTGSELTRVGIQVVCIVSEDVETLRSANRGRRWGVRVRVRVPPSRRAVPHVTWPPKHTLQVPDPTAMNSSHVCGH